MRRPFFLAFAAWLAIGAPAAALETRRCAGAGTLRDLAVVWAGLLAKQIPAYRVEIDTHAALSADGFESLLAGRTACAPFVRELFAAEQRAFREKFGYAPLLVPVAGGSYATKGGTHAIAIYVNAANPLTRITLPQLRGILSGSVTRWGELGLGAPWDQRPIAVYGMLIRRESGNPPGIVNFLMNRIMGETPFRADLREQHDAPNESALAAIVRNVAADETGIGYSGFGFSQPGAKSLAVAETAAGPFRAGTPAEVADRSYALSRRIYVLVNRAPGQPLDPVMAAYLKTALSRAGQEALGRDRMHFLPLTRAERRKSLALID